MAWPKGKPRGKKNKLLGAVFKNKDGTYSSSSEYVKSHVDSLTSLQGLSVKVSEVRGMIGLPDTKVYIDQHKVYFISLINEKIISFKIFE